MTYTAIDVFAGCGGLTQGLRQSRFNVVGAVEVDERAAINFRLNHKKVDLQQIDIRDLDLASWRKKLNLRKGELDLLAGCPPCQGFSSIRTKNGSYQVRDKRNDLVKEMVRFIEEFLPKAVLMENVPGLAHKAGFKKLVRELTRLGYNPAWNLHDVSDYGVPQRRKRLVLTAGRGFEIPIPKTTRLKTTVRVAIGKLPSPGASGDALHDLPEKRSALTLKRISATPKDGGSRNAWPQHLRLTCHKNADGFYDVYGRMKWDDISPTITGGCFNPSKGRFLHPTEDRCITLREAALLQSFPMKYKFDTTTGKQAIALMIGNALPPLFARKQGEAVRSALAQKFGKL